MRKVIGISVTVLLVAFLAACAGREMSSEPMSTMSSESAMPAANGQAVIDYITKDSPYQQWSLWPGKGKLYPGTRPHGAFLTTYVNQSALKGIEEQGGELPDGAIIVKENYMPDKTLAAVTVMYKKAGYNPPAKDIFWLKYTPDGKIAAEGKVNSCIGCHGAAKGGDFLYTNDGM